MLRLLAVAAIVGSCWVRMPSAAQANEPARAPRIHPRMALEARLLEDGADGRYDRLGLISAALIAGGAADEAQLHKRQNHLDRHVQTLRDECATLSSPRDRAAAALALLHRELLTGNYVANCADLAITFETGDYNCITATILYVALVSEIGLTPEAQHAPGHVWVQLRELPQPVETTCRTWFSLPGSEHQPRVGSALTPAALVGKLYFNRGLQSLDQHNYAAATAAFQRSTQLDPTDTAAKQNWLAALNNGALAFCEQRDFTTAETYLAQASQIDPEYPPLQANQLHLQQRWVVSLCEAGEYAAALQRLNAGASRFPQAELFRGGKVVVYRLWAEDLQRRGETHAALTKVELALAIEPHDQTLQQLKQSLAK